MDPGDLMSVGAMDAAKSSIHDGLAGMLLPPLIEIVTEYTINRDIYERFKVAIAGEDVVFFWDYVWDLTIDAVHSDGHMDCMITSCDVHLAFRTAIDDLWDFIASGSVTALVDQIRSAPDANTSFGGFIDLIPHIERLEPLDEGIQGLRDALRKWMAGGFPECT